MITVIVQHTVRDYDTWKPVFDEHGDIRRRHGATGHQLYRGADDPNAVTILNQFPTREQAEAFANDPSLPEAMKRGGVTGEPRVSFTRETETVDYRESKTKAA